MKWLEPAPLAVDLVLVAVDEDEAGILPGGPGYLVEGILGQGIVVVHEGAPRAPGHGQGIVGGPGDMAVLAPRSTRHTGIRRGGAGEKRAHRGVGGGVVDGAEFPWG